MRTIKELLLEWFNQVSRRRAIAATRLLIGIEHAKCNNNVVVLEEELIQRWGGASFLLPNGQVVEIGKPGCAMAERTKLRGTADDSTTAISALPPWSYCEARAEAGIETPIERFIYDNEPMDGASGGQLWRAQLLHVLNYAHTHVL